jgi:hypothetical protein
VYQRKHCNGFIEEGWVLRAIVVGVYSSFSFSRIGIDAAARRAGGLIATSSRGYSQ